MGSSVNALCECGYQASSLIGGGMANFMEVCHFPFLCEQCREIVEVNLLEKKLRCPKCSSKSVIPYDDKKLLGKAGKLEVASWNMEEQLGRVLRLTDGKYLCPSCGEYKLSFAPGDILWD